MELTTENSISAFDILRQRIGTPTTLIPNGIPESSIRWTTRVVAAFKKHWPEYLMEVACAKLHHHNNQRCIFRCNFKANR